VGVAFRHVIQEFSRLLPKKAAMADTIKPTNARNTWKSLKLHPSPSGYFMTVCGSA
jgi:hypothetical protein